MFSIGVFYAVPLSISSPAGTGPYSKVISLLSSISLISLLFLELTYFLSLRRVYRLVINVVVGLVLFLLACLLMHLVHQHKVKKGHPPYSKWYVIAPYLTSIAAMTVLTAMLTYHLFAIDAVRIVCGSFTMLAIFLLSLRGTLRYKRKSSILLTTFLFVLFAVTFLFFDRTAKLPFSWVRMTAFALGVALLSVAAVRTFREPEPKEEGSAAD